MMRDHRAKTRTARTERRTQYSLTTTKKGEDFVFEQDIGKTHLRREKRKKRDQQHSDPLH